MQKKPQMNTDGGSRKETWFRRDGVTVWWAFFAGALVSIIRVHLCPFVIIPCFRLHRSS